MRLIKSGILLASAVSLLAITACNPAKDGKATAQASKEPVRQPSTERPSARERST